MAVSLRTKIFLPLLSLMALLIGYIYGYWMPQSLAGMDRQYQEATKRHLESVVEGMIPLLLGRELDTIYENFDALLNNNSDWISILLTDAPGRPLYPLGNVPGPRSTAQVQNLRTLTMQIAYLDMKLGTLTVTVDLSMHLAEWKREFHRAVLVMLVVLVGIVLSIGIVLERTVVRPVKALGTAAQSMGQARFDALHLKAGDDEVGHLVDSFNAMRENLAASYNLISQSRDKYSALYNETPVLLHSEDATGVIVEVNDFWLKTLGFERDEVLGKKATDFYAEASRQYAAEVVRPAFLLDGFCKDIPYRFVKKNGELVDVLLSATAERDENGNIARCLAVIVDVTDRRKIENRLLLSEQKNRAITTTANDAIIMMDENGYISFWNPAAESIFGYAAEEAFGSYLHAVIVPDRYIRDYEKGFQHFRETGKGSAVGKTVEMTAKRKDGTEFPVELSLSALRMEGRWHAVGFVRDITQRKQAESKILASLEEKEVLLQEVHHRVKNNMQVIASLLDLQLDFVQGRRPQEFFSDIKNRIRAMALVHERLYRSKDLSNVDFHDYISVLVQNLYRFYSVNPEKIRLQLDAEGITFGIDTAIPLGLIVNELVTNSLKYAFPANRAGEVSVMLREVGEESDGRRLYGLTVRDNGIGVPEALELKDITTMGLYLVTTLVEHQLQGSINLKRGEGTEFIIRFKEVKAQKRV